MLKEKKKHKSVLWTFHWKNSIFPDKYLSSYLLDKNVFNTFKTFKRTKHITNLI